ncbi:hypothetical protein [Streptomyces sp. NPDC054874]
MTKRFLMALCLSLAGAVGISWALVFPAAADAGTRAAGSRRTGRRGGLVPESHATGRGPSHH